MDEPMKKIIHIDADCFFAALEMRENPGLRDQPVAVGGDPGRRGVVATCNYLARQYGVRSAMAAAHAARLCPGLVFVRPNFELYRQASRQMHDIFHRYSDRIEPLSLDEAYLDVSGSELCRGSATLIAESIRRDIFHEMGITVSAGVAPVKFVAKVASDWHKPDGLCTVSPQQLQSFVQQLPVTRLPGVGRVTADRLARFGVYQCADLTSMDTQALVKHFGAFGDKLKRMASGIDEREVVCSHDRKSVSIERTYPEDIDSRNLLGEHLEALLEGLSHRYEKLKSRYAAQKKFIKLKFDNFTQTTMEMPVSPYGNLFARGDYERLMHASWQRQQRPVRLMGVGIRLQEPVDPAQLALPFAE